MDEPIRGERLFVSENSSARRSNIWVAQTEWRGRFVLLAKEQTPKHLLMPGNASQHVVPNSQRIRTELAYREPWPIDEAIPRTTVWQQANPPAGATFHQFDYEAEDAALAKVA
jgi:hypothetical protein